VKTGFSGLPGTYSGRSIICDASRGRIVQIYIIQQPVKWANVLNQGSCTINQIFTHNIVLIADPDTLLVHDLPLEEARVSAHRCFARAADFLCDKLAGLSESRMKMLQQTLPVADVRPVNLHPYFSMLPVGNLQVEINGWAIIMWWPFLTGMMRQKLFL
jgi:hypothetical protein